MQPYQIASTPLLRTVVEAIPYSPMAHHLCDVRFVLAAEALFRDTQAFTSLCERPCDKTIEPLLIADIGVMVIINVTVRLLG